jgi:hypothetical protein
MFVKHFAALGVRSPIQRKTVEILSELKGYSKRVTLLKDQLRKDLAREGIGSGSIDAKLSEMISLGLLTENPGADGTRFALNKNIWDLQPNIVEFVTKVADHFANEMRSDAKFQGVLTKVKTKIKESGRLESKLNHQTYVILVSCTLRKHHDWTFDGGQVIRKGEKPDISTSSVQQEMQYDNAPRKINVDQPPSANEAPKEQKPTVLPKASSTDGFNLRPLNIDLISSQIELFLPESLIDSFGKESIRYFGDLAAIDIPLSLGRGQKVFIGLRRNAVHEKVFWLFSLCGPIESVQESISDIVWHNNECEPFKITCLELTEGHYMGVCYVMNTDDNWFEQLPVKIRKLAAFGDRLEELYWRQDEF